MDLLKREDYAMLESQVRENQSMAKMKWFKTQVDEMCFIFNLEYRYVVYQEGCNIDYLTQSKVLIGHPSKNPERKPLRTNFVLPGWSSVNLVDQVSHLNLGLGSSGPNRSNRSGGLVWPVPGLTASWSKQTGLTGPGAGLTGPRV